MEEVARNRIVGAAVLILIGVTLPLLLSRCMHGPVSEDQAMRVYELAPSGGIEPINQLAANDAPAAATPSISQHPDDAEAGAAGAGAGSAAATSPGSDTQSAPDAVESAPAAPNEAGLRRSVASGSWVVQIASFASEPDARALAERLNGAYPVYYTAAQVNGGTWFRVRIGPFDSGAAANNAAAELQAQGRDTLVVRVD